MKLNKMSVDQLKEVIKENGLKVSTKGKTKEQLLDFILRAKPELGADDEEKDDDDEDDGEDLIEVPEWDEDDVQSTPIDDIMDLEYFEENVLKCDIRTLGRLERNDQGHARIATRKARVWMCDDCFPTADKIEEPDLYKEQAAELKAKAHIVTMTKADPLCARSEWYKKNDGKKAIDAYGNKFRVNYAKEMARINYFIHVDSFSGEDIVNDTDDLL